MKLIARPTDAEQEAPHSGNSANRRTRLIYVAIIAVVAALQFGKMVTLRLDHDENQFVASGALLARHGLLPYRDYPYFHVPYLTVIYGLIFRVTHYLLLSARCLSVICGTGTVAVLFFASHHLFRDGPAARRWWFATTAILALMGNPLFMVTSGRAWNHDAPTLFTLCAILLLLRTKDKPGNSWQVLVAGMLVGLSAGLRLTFAPVIASCALAIFLLPGTSWARRREILATFLLGCVDALMPLVILFAMAPHQFLFGIFRFPFLNLEWRKTNAPLPSMSVAGKLLFPVTHVLDRPATFLVGALFVAGLCVVYARRHGRSEHPRRYEATALLLVLLALFIGVLAPTPSFVQYFYTPIPFEILLALYVASGSTGKWARGWSILFGMTALAAVGFGFSGYQGILQLGAPSRWIPIQVHDIGRDLATATNHGRILTLGPVFPLEGNCTTYEEFATGPFAFRVASLVHEDNEAELHVLDADDLNAVLRGRPPAAVLLPRKRALEGPFIAYALRHRIPIYRVDEIPAEPSAEPWTPRQLSLIRETPSVSEADDAAGAE